MIFNSSSSSSSSKTNTCIIIKIHIIVSSIFMILFSDWVWNLGHYYAPSSSSSSSTCVCRWSFNWIRSGWRQLLRILGKCWRRRCWLRHHLLHTTTVIATSCSILTALFGYIIHICWNFFFFYSIHHCSSN